MNLKKAAVMILALVMGNFIFSADVNARPIRSYQDIKTSLERNEILPLNLFRNHDLDGHKKELGQLAQRQVAKHKNYTAYYNAALIYLTEDYFDEIYNLTDTEMANIKKYATEAIRLSPKTPDMYLVRGMAILNGYNFGEAGNMSYSGRDCFTPLVKERITEVRAMLRDFEKVGELNPSMAPWRSMQEFYEALGNTEAARRCAAKAETYERRAAARQARVSNVQRNVKHSLTDRVKSWLPGWMK